jgi:hypothetical protein
MLLHQCVNARACGLWPPVILHEHEFKTRQNIRLLPRWLPASFKTFAWPTPEMYASTATLPPNASALLRLHCTGSTSTSTCIATTRHPAAQALRQPRRAPRVLVSRPQRLYIDYAVRRRNIVFWLYDYFDYSSRLVSPRKLVGNGFRGINN